MKTEAQIYAETFEFVRSITKFYLSKLGNTDVNKSFEIDGKKLNNPYWIAAHLTWSEHLLILTGIGAKPMDIPWLEKFSIGTEPSNDPDLPGFAEVLETMDIVHVRAMGELSSLTDEQLDEPNSHNFAFGGANTKRNIIKHAIRHEPMHVGQLSWYLKVNDIKMP